MTTRATFVIRIPALALVFALVAANAPASVIKVINMDGPGEGFNDATPRTPAAGNPGTTVGQQRLNVMQRAADTWGAILQSSVEIEVEAVMDPLECSATSALLGSAGPVDVFRNITGEPRASTWYHSALGNSFKGSDLGPSDPDISARFNSNLGMANCLGGTDWYYGFDNNPPGGTINFLSTVLHEYAHGLGFSTFVDKTTGGKFLGFDDIYMAFLEDHSTGKKWPDMTNTERKASAIDTGDLHWTGTNVIANASIYLPLPEAATVLTGGVHPSGHVEMYAPNPLEGGSSVSHWSTSLTPNELMEPFNSPGLTDIVTTPLFQDEGWSIASGPTSVGPSGTTYEVEPNLAADINGNGITDGDELFTLQPLGGSGNVVTFDGVRENLKQFVPALVPNTTPRITESMVNLGGQGKDTIRLTLTMDTANGNSFWPDGLADPTTQTPLTDGAFVIGFFNGSDPLDFANRGVKGATFTLMSGNTTVATVTLSAAQVAAIFGSGAWDGNLAIVFSDVTKLSINKLVAVVDVEVDAQNPTGIPTAAFSFTVSGLTANFQNQSQGATSYSWNFGDGTTSTATNPSRTYASAGTYSVALTATNGGGSNSIAKSVTVAGPAIPTAGFESSVVGRTVSFVNTTTGGDSFEWSMGDGFLSLTNSPTHTYNTPGSYGVTLIAKNQAGSSAPLTKVVLAETDPLPPPALPTAAFDFTVAGLTVAFQNQTQGATTFAWNFGDGGTSTVMSPSHIYSAAGAYSVTQTASNTSGSNSITKTIVAIQPPPGLEFGPFALLSGNRFRVSMTILTQSGASGQGQGAVYEDASSFWHFFGKQNIEVFVKVLNACAINGHYWAFLAGATNVRVIVTVTDTQTGLTKIYTNPLGVNFVTVTDIEAFGC